MNAANLNGTSATWDLCLNKPYDDGGYENSTRVYGAAGFDMQPPLHCRTWSDGTLNDPTRPPTRWTAEVALPLAGLAVNKTAAVPPAPGDQWRINFSRVEWGVTVVDGAYQKAPACQSCPVPGTPTEDNWAWSPQGEIAMHLPERWGILQFAAGAVNATAPVRNPEWTVRSVAMALYYAEHAFASANNGTFTADVTSLFWYTPDPAVLAGACSSVPAVTLAPGGGGFNASLASLDGAQVATITDDRFLRVAHA
jgi:hypothetical protein